MPKGNQLDERMSASSFVEGSEPGLVGISGWEAKGASKDEWIEYDTSDNPRIAVESRTLIHKSVQILYLGLCIAYNTEVLTN